MKHYVAIELDGTLTAKRITMDKTGDFSKDIDFVRSHFAGLGYEVGSIRFS